MVKNSSVDAISPELLTPKTFLGPAEIRSIAAALNVRPTKTLGQNFVHDPSTVRKIVAESGVTPGDRVLEVGPGLGSLTLALLEAGAYVCAIEIDPVLARALPQTIQHHQPDAIDRFALVCADAMSIVSSQDLALPPSLVLPTELEALPERTLHGSGDGAEVAPLVYEPTHLVANLPYNVAVPVLLTLLEALPSLRHITVMVQAEVADRLAAGPGSKTYGVPSVKMAWYGAARRGVKISRNVFWPVPNVDSALVHVDVCPASESVATRDGSLRERVFAVVDAAFSQRRKTLRSALAQWAGSPAQAQEILTIAGIDSSQRGETLSLPDFVNIAQAAVRDS